MTFNHPITTFKSATDTDAKFSILIPSWNNLEILKICVESIIKNSTFKHEIIIHVNQGSDGTLDWVKKSNLSYTFSTENVGVCYAMNAMATLATTNYILYLNDDMYTCPNWDFYLLDAIEKNNNNYFYFSATMIEPTGSKNKCVISPFNFGTNADNFSQEALLDFATTASKPDWFGASWPPSIVHREIWDLVKGYSNEFSPGFGSDPDFSMKLWQAGVREYRGIGKSLVYHFQSKSTARVVKNDGRKTFAKKWGIPISYFYKNILRLGRPYDGKPLKMKKNFSFKMAQLRAWWISIKK